MTAMSSLSSLAQAGLEEERRGDSLAIEVPFPILVNAIFVFLGRYKSGPGFGRELSFSVSSSGRELKTTARKRTEGEALE